MHLTTKIITHPDTERHSVNLCKTGVTLSCLSVYEMIPMGLKSRILKKTLNLISYSIKILLLLCRNGQHNPDKQWGAPMEALRIEVRGQAVTITMCPYSSCSHWNLHYLLFADGLWFICCIKPWHDAAMSIFIYFVTIARLHEFTSWGELDVSGLCPVRHVVGSTGLQLTVDLFPRDSCVLLFTESSLSLLQDF